VMSGYSPRFLVVIIPAAAFLFFVRAFAQGNYQAQRIQGLLSGIFEGQYSHQVTQGLYALGSGGLFGAGLGLSRQKYFYLPEAHNDFILAVIGEEMGLMGTLMVIGAFLLLLWAGFTITQGARDKMGRVLAAGATTILITQAIINLFAVVGLGPVTGKPLPFVTLGGSAMMSSFMLLGILLSVARFGGEPQKEYTDHSSWFARVSDYMTFLLGDSFPAPTPKRPKEPQEPKKPKRPKRPKKPQKQRRGRPESPGGEEDESDFEWRWDSRSRVSSSRTRS